MVTGLPWILSLLTVLALSGISLGNHETNGTGTARRTPRLIGFIVPGTNGGRPRLRLMPGANRFLGPGRRIAAARLSQLRNLRVNQAATRAANVRPLPFNVQSIIDATRRALGRQNMPANGRQPNVVFVRPPARNADSGATAEVLRQLQLAARQGASSSSSTSASAAPAAPSAARPSVTSSMSSTSSSSSTTQETRQSQAASTRTRTATTRTRSRAELIALIQRRLQVLAATGRLNSNSTGRLRALLQRLRAGGSQPRPVVRTPTRVDEAVLRAGVNPVGAGSTQPAGAAVPNVPSSTATVTRPVVAGSSSVAGRTRVVGTLSAVPSVATSGVPSVSTSAIPAVPTGAVSSVPARTLADLSGGRIPSVPTSTVPAGSTSAIQPVPTSAIDGSSLSADIDLQFRTVVDSSAPSGSVVGVSSTNEILSTVSTRQPPAGDIAPTLNLGPAFQLIPPADLAPSSTTPNSDIGLIDFSMQGTPAGAMEQGRAGLGAAIPSSVAPDAGVARTDNTLISGVGDSIPPGTATGSAGLAISIDGTMDPSGGLWSPPPNEVVPPTSAVPEGRPISISDLLTPPAGTVAAPSGGLLPGGGSTLDQFSFGNSLSSSSLDVSATLGAAGSMAASEVTRSSTADVPIAFDDLEKCMVRSSSSAMWSESVVTVPRSPNTVCSCSCRETTTSGVESSTGSTASGVPAKEAGLSNVADVSALRTVIVSVLKDMFSSSFYDVSNQGVQPDIGRLAKAILESQNKTVSTETKLSSSNIAIESQPAGIISDVITPDVVVPDVIAPEVIVPDVVAPDVTAPEVIVPDVVVPDVIAPEAIVPDVFAPDVIAPEVIVPDVVQPDVFLPDVVPPPIPMATQPTLPFDSVTEVVPLTAATMTTPSSPIVLPVETTQTPTITTTPRDGLNILVGDWSGAKLTGSENTPNPVAVDTVTTTPAAVPHGGIPSQTSNTSKDVLMPDAQPTYPTTEYFTFPTTVTTTQASAQTTTPLPPAGDPAAAVAMDTAILDGVIAASDNTSATSTSVELNATNTNQTEPLSLEFMPSLQAGGVPIYVTENGHSTSPQQPDNIQLALNSTAPLVLSRPISGDLLHKVDFSTLGGANETADTATSGKGDAFPNTVSDTTIAASSFGMSSLPVPDELINALAKNSGRNPSPAGFPTVSADSSSIFREPAFAFPSSTSLSGGGLTNPFADSSVNTISSADSTVIPIATDAPLPPLSVPNVLGDVSDSITITLASLPPQRPKPTAVSVDEFTAPGINAANPTVSGSIIPQQPRADLDPFSLGSILTPSKSFDTSFDSKRFDVSTTFDANFASSVEQQVPISSTKLADSFITNTGNVATALDTQFSTRPLGTTQVDRSSPQTDMSFTGGGFAAPPSRVQTPVEVPAIDNAQNFVELSPPSPPVIQAAVDLPPPPPPDNASWDTGAPQDTGSSPDFVTPSISNPSDFTEPAFVDIQPGVSTMDPSAGFSFIPDIPTERLGPQGTETLPDVVATATNDPAPSVGDPSVPAIGNPNLPQDVGAFAPATFQEIPLDFQVNIPNFQNIDSTFVTPDQIPPDLVFIDANSQLADTAGISFTSIFDSTPASSAETPGPSAALPGSDLGPDPSIGQPSISDPVPAPTWPAGGDTSASFTTGADTTLNDVAFSNGMTSSDLGPMINTVSDASPVESSNQPSTSATGPENIDVVIEPLVPGPPPSAVGDRRVQVPVDLPPPPPF